MSDVNEQIYFRVIQTKEKKHFVRQSIRCEAKAEQRAPLVRPGAGACSGQLCKACRVSMPRGGGGC